MNKMPDRIDSKFRFVLLAAERAEQMMIGAQAKVEMEGHKPSRVAMEEVSGDLIEWDYGPAEEAESEPESVAETGSTAASEDK